VDFVLTFEELAGIMEARGVDLSIAPEEEELHYGSAAGRGFAQSGGVAKAVADKIHEWYPDKEVKIASAEGLANCKKMLMMAKAGKVQPATCWEGMGLPGRLHRRRRHHRRPRAHRGPAEQVRCRGPLQGPRGERVHLQHPPAEGRPRL